MLQATYRNKFDRKLNKLFLWKASNEEFKFPKRMELLLHINGSLGYDLRTGKWVIGHFDGVKDDLNDYVKYVGHTLSSEPESVELKNHTEVIVCGNNELYTNDIEENNWFSKMLEDTDISIYYQLVNSRNIPMLVADTDKVKEEIELAFSKMRAGVPVVVTTDLMNEVKTLDITDNTSIDRISTLDNFHEELIKRWCNSYGIDVETKEKKAQVNEMELDSFGDYDTMNFLEMYEARLDFVKEMTENGFEIECVRNPIYWDEPTEEDIENGEFEENENDDVVEQEGSETEGDSGTEETGESAPDDDKRSD